MKELVCLAVFTILSVLFAIAMIIAGFICQYKKNSNIKNSIYECGIQVQTDSRINFDIKYFNYAIAFLIFDVETVFLYPFAVYFNQFGFYVIVETFVFVGLLLFGLYFAINKKFLRWN